MEKIVISTKARISLDDLIDILYYQDYFSYKINAENYVNNLYDFISAIPERKHKHTKNTKHGDLYCSYKYNTRTTQYFIFDIVDAVYFVKYITNNHTVDYVNLIG